MIQLSSPKGYLTSISGYHFASSKKLKAGIRSLTFQTNKRMIEPIGDEEGRYFSSPATSGKIVGFCGWSGEHREAIGTYFEPISHLNPIESIEPFVVSSGETGDGSSGETWDHGKFKGVREIEVQHDINIHYIKFVYDGGNQSYQVTYKGCTKGDYPKVTTVILDFPQEYLTSIFGYTRDGAIQSLTFYSNKGRYGPFGKETGKYFWYPLNGNRITGFYGARDPDNETLKSIGLYVEPIPHIHPFKTVGPIGGSGGTEWDDGVHTDARGFRMSFDKAIMAIGIAYDNNGSFMSGSEHWNGYDNNGSSVSGLEPGERCKVLAGSCSIYHPRPENIFPKSLLRAVHSGIPAKAT
ncbi:hypothetical protein BT93_I1651 [Corymbia citriodora subsp. variegata]|nr:hypothetical protein BT93_I1651 [Corymbia citriodora subsp. variegata]